LFAESVEQLEESAPNDVLLLKRWRDFATTQFLKQTNLTFSFTLN
jgi:hypothetical protein